MITFELFEFHRTNFEILPLGTRTNDREFWLSRTPEERFAACEFLRQMNYGYDPATTRLQRFLEILER